jgi:hypothetical protein
MKLRGIVTLLLAFVLCGKDGIAWPDAAAAQSLTATTEQPVALTAATPTTTALTAVPPSATTPTALPPASSTRTPPWSAVNLPGTAVYQDNLIGGGSLAPDISKGDDDGSDAGGLARSLQDRRGGQRIEYP